MHFFLVVNETLLAKCGTDDFKSIEGGRNSVDSLLNYFLRIGNATGKRSKMNREGCQANYCERRLYALVADKRPDQTPPCSSRVQDFRPVDVTHTARKSTTNDREGPQRLTGLKYCLSAAAAVCVSKKHWKNNVQSSLQHAVGLCTRTFRHSSYGAKHGFNIVGCPSVRPSVRLSVSIQVWR